MLKGQGEGHGNKSCVSVNPVSTEEVTGCGWACAPGPARDPEKEPHGDAVSRRTPSGWRDPVHSPAPAPGPPQPQSAQWVQHTVGAHYIFPVLNWSGRDLRLPIPLSWG